VGLYSSGQVISPNSIEMSWACDSGALGHRETGESYVRTGLVQKFLGL
jgi:hypothetical protein